MRSTRLTDELLAELSYDLLDDPVEATRLADDCLRLSEVLPEDFAQMRRTRWYRDLWRCLGRRHLPALGLACASVIQARELLAEVLREMILGAPRGAALLERLEDALAFRKGRPGGLGRDLLTLEARALALRHQLDRHGDHAADERSLPEVVRVLLLRAMIAAAWADDEINAAEVKLLTRKVQDLDLSEAATEEILREIDTPRPLERDLGEIKDPELRSLLYRNIAAVTIADGRIALAENLFLAHFAGILEIPAEEASRVEQELFGLVNRGGLDALVRAVGRGTDRPDPVRLPATRTAPPPAAREVFAEAGELWSRLLVSVADRLSWSIAESLARRLETVGTSTSLADALDRLSPDETREQLSVSMDANGAEWGTWLDQTLAEALPELVDNPDLSWMQTGGDHLRASFERSLDPIIELLQVANTAGRSVQALQLAPLEHLRDQGMLQVFSAPNTTGRQLFAVPDQQILRDEEQKVIRDYTSALGAILHGAEALRQRLAEQVFEIGAAYFEAVLVPLLLGRLRGGHDPRPVLAVLARRGAELSRAD